MHLETERLILRPWMEADAESLYEYAKDPDVGTPAGWPAHKSVEESLDVIRNVFTGIECYAICEKESLNLCKYTCCFVNSGWNRQVVHC